MLELIFDFVYFVAVDVCCCVWLYMCCLGYLLRCFIRILIIFRTDWRFLLAVSVSLSLCLFNCWFLRFPDVCICLGILGLCWLFVCCCVICSLIMFANGFAVFRYSVGWGYLLLLLFSDLVCVCCFVLFVVFLLLLMCIIYNCLALSVGFVLVLIVGGLMLVWVIVLFSFYALV